MLQMISPMLPSAKKAKESLRKKDSNYVKLEQGEKITLHFGAGKNSSLHSQPLKQYVNKGKKR